MYNLPDRINQRLTDEARAGLHQAGAEGRHDENAIDWYWQLVKDGYGLRAKEWWVSEIHPMIEKGARP